MADSHGARVRRLDCKDAERPAEPLPFSQKNPLKSQKLQVHAKKFQGASKPKSPTKPMRAIRTSCANSAHRMKTPLKKLSIIEPDASPQRHRETQKIYPKGL